MIALLLSGAVLAAGTQCPASVDAEQWTELTRREDFVVVLRVSGECHSDLEVQVIDRGDEVEVEMIEAAGQGFDEQLRSLRKENPDELESTLCSSLQLTHRRLSAEEEPALRALIDDLDELRISPVPAAEIYLHGVHYELRISSIGNTSAFQFSGHGREGAAEATLTPLESWTRRLLDLIGAACERRQ